jgi:hypothetical protein
MGVKCGLSVWGKNMDWDSLRTAVCNKEIRTLNIAESYILKTSSKGIILNILVKWGYSIKIYISKIGNEGVNRIKLAQDRV